MRGPTIDIPILNSQGLWWLALSLLLLSMYAAIWMHRVGLLIFGDKAGIDSTKTDEVIVKHITFFATGVPPSELPKTESIAESMTSAVSSEKLRLGVFLRFIPVGPIYLYSLIAWLWISKLLLEGDTELVAGAFWLTLFIFVFRDRIINYLPGYIPTESASAIDEAEYIRTRQLIQEKGGEENRPRIEPSPEKGHRRIR